MLLCEVEMIDKSGFDFPEREAMDVDVAIVGAGPAGLSAAIRLKQLAESAGVDLNVTVLEKGAEVGAHILAGAVIDPAPLTRLLPDWKERDAPLNVRVTKDRFLFLGSSGALRIPNFIMPPLMSNHGNYVISLGNLCRWMAVRAEEYGVEIYPGFSASEIIHDENGAVKGVATGDFGVGRDGQPKSSFVRGMELHAKYTLFAEGARGSLTERLIDRFKLADGREPRKFGIGIKELWSVDPDRHDPGLIQHTFGWPLNRRIGGGSFLYHLDKNQVAVGFVVHLNYSNPYLSPFEEFQRFKTHPAIRETFENGERLAYGARVITEGGYQSVPKLFFPGGALIGCTAGLVNVPRIKGIHNAIASGMLAAENLFKAIQDGRAGDELSCYGKSFQNSEIVRDLKMVRNVKPLWSRFGTVGGIFLGGFDMWCNNMLGFSLFGTMRHGRPDHVALDTASAHRKIDYPKPDGIVSFDRLSSVFLSNVNHAEDQPVHLRVTDMELQLSREYDMFDGPSGRYCPAGVYEWIKEDGDKPYFQINAQNCVHCKTCDIKDPSRNIVWTVPEGGGGPNYPNM